MSCRVLCLDGGGIRGVFQAQLLDRLRAYIGRIDLIVGVSVGALNGIVFSEGKLRNLDVLSLPNAKKIFDKSVTDKIFGEFQFQPVYTGSGRAEVIESNIFAKFMGDLPIPMAIVTYDLTANQTKVFKSWDDHKALLYDVAMATSAAPIYFPPYKMGNHIFLDGGIAINNPSLLGMALGKELFPNLSVKVLSIGAESYPEMARGTNVEKFGSIQWIAAGLYSRMISEDSIMQSSIAEKLLGDQYLRVNRQTNIETDQVDAYDYLVRMGREVDITPIIRFLNE